MRKYLYSILSGVALLGAVNIPSAQAAVSVGISLDVPFPVGVVAYGPRHSRAYAPAYSPAYYPAPVYYAPPPVYYAPPVVYAPPVYYRPPVYYAPRVVYARPAYRQHYQGHGGHYGHRR